jgi:hypothetical protein
VLSPSIRVRSFRSNSASLESPISLVDKAVLTLSLGTSLDPLGLLLDPLGLKCGYLIQHLLEGCPFL